MIFRRVVTESYRERRIWCREDRITSSEGDDAARTICRSCECRTTGADLDFIRREVRDLHDELIRCVASDCACLCELENLWDTS